MRCRLLPAWLRLLQGDVLELLHRLDVENCAQTALEMLSALFTVTPADELLQDRVQLDNRYTQRTTPSLLLWLSTKAVMFFSPPFPAWLCLVCLQILSYHHSPKLEAKAVAGKQFPWRALKRDLLLLFPPPSPPHPPTSVGLSLPGS